MLVFPLLDETMIATLLAPISASFDSLSNLSWIATTYLIGTSASNPLSGHVADVLGRRYCLMASVAIFIIRTLICGLSTRLWILLLGRSIQGFGSGTMQSVVSCIEADLVTIRNRGITEAVGGILFGVCLAVGGVIWWRDQRCYRLEVGVLYPGSNHGSLGCGCLVYRHDPKEEVRYLQSTPARLHWWYCYPLCHCALPAQTSIRREYSFLEVTSCTSVPSIVSSSLRYLPGLGPLLCQGASRANTTLTAPQRLPLVIVLFIQSNVVLHN